ncbi:GNAT family N-acetyltransferase [Streptomyces chattanoogensis]|uniref:GNAT family N-acetyltransferase n=1 Tax=Streptomyces chattanoogensis TaxID=66876 RepID=UPI0036A1959B
MTSDIVPAIPAGTLCAAAQPSLASCDGELLLRPWAGDDAAVLLAAYQDSVIQRWSVRRLRSREDAAEWIAVWGREWQRESSAHWAVARADDGAVVGRVSLRRMDLLHGLGDCAYWVLPQARGKGIAPRSLATLADWAFDEAGFHRLELMHSDRNEASCRVAAKAGFAGEGIRRSALLHADGWHDMHQHARVQGDA